MSLQLDPSHDAGLRRVGGQLALLAGVLLVFWVTPLPVRLRGLAGYVPLHTLLETLAIAVSGLIASVAWGGRRGKVARSVTVLGCVFIGVAALDLSHILSFQGMPDYVTPSGPEKSIDFWLAARLLAAAALLWVSVAPWGSAQSRLFRIGLLSAVLALAALVHWAILLHPESLPRTFIAGEGLTGFKIGTEYLIIALDLAAAALLLWRMRLPLAFNASALLGAVATMAMSEVFFTLYGRNITDALSLVGHVYKVISYLFLYQLVFVEAIERPYREVEALQHQLKATLEAVPDLFFEFDRNGRYLSYHSPPSDLLAVAPEHFIGRTVFEVLPPAAAATCMQAIREADEKGFSRGLQIALDLPIGQRWFELTVSRRARVAGEAARFIGLSRDVTESRQARDALRDSEERYRKLFVNSPYPTWVYDAQTLAFLDVNEAAVTSYGYTAAEFLSLTLRDIRPAEDVPALEALFTGELPAVAPTRIWRHRRKDGSTFLAEISAHTLNFDDRRARLAMAADVTEREEMKEKVAEGARQTRAILDNVIDGVITIDRQGSIGTFNLAAAGIFGYTAGEVQGRNISLLMPEPDRSAHDRYLREYAATGVRHIIGTGRDVRGMRKDGTTFPMSLAVSETELAGQPVYIGIVRDITERRAAEAEIERLAFYDQLTELPNRRLLIDRLSRALLMSERRLQLGALLFIDLDDFKLLNDSWGHDYGDRVLTQVARRLCACVREGDTVGRLGGDEFLVMLENLGTSRELAASNAEAVARKVMAAFESPFRLDGRDQRSTPSTGITLFGDERLSAGELMARADNAMYQAKSDGRNTYRFFDAQLQASLAARAALDTDLRQSLVRNELLLHYQPQFGPQHRIFGVEALLRWSHPRRSAVSPAEFIPIAEQSGFIIELGQWVLETACRKLGAWSAAPHAKDLRVSINVSATQFRDPRFVNWVLEALARHGARADRLKLELTESLLAEDVENVIGKMNSLKAHGVAFSLDDFGTGYSSLNYLKRLPLDELKIDQSFVRDVLVDANDAAIARTVVALGQTFGLAVIAEGVESAEQRDFLERIGYTAYQGFLFSRPLGEAELETFLLRHRENGPT